jgi:hypothetical protein
LHYGVKYCPIFLLQQEDPKMRTILVGVVVMALAGLSPRAPDQPNILHEQQRTSIASQLIGTWRLLSRETTTSNGERIVDPGLGARPIGYLIYDSTGHVVAQLMRENRSVSEMENCGSRRTKGRNNVSSFCGYDAYFGTYTLDETQGAVTHHLEGALSPDDVGKDVRRSFVVTDDRLTITFSTTSPADLPAKRTLVWERVK